MEGKDVMVSRLDHLLELSISMIVMMIRIGTIIIENKKKEDELKNDVDENQKIEGLKCDSKKWDMKIEKEMHLEIGE